MYVTLSNFQTPQKVITDMPATSVTLSNSDSNNSFVYNFKVFGMYANKYFFINLFMNFAACILVWWVSRWLVWLGCLATSGNDSCIPHENLRGSKCPEPAI